MNKDFFHESHISPRCWGTQGADKLNYFTETMKKELSEKYNAEVTITNRVDLSRSGFGMKEQLYIKKGDEFRARERNSKTSR